MELELNRLADRYRARGYGVVVHPTPDQLPEFARGFQVELLGQRAGEGVLVAVRKNRSELAGDPAVADYARVTAGIPGWRFDLAVLEAESEDVREGKDAQDLSDADIVRSLDQAGELTELGYPQAAILAAWAALESTMRIRLRATGGQAGWGSPPRQVLRELYSAGALTPDEFRLAEQASKLRNYFAHGFANDGTDASSLGLTVKALSDITRRLLNETQPLSQPAA